MFPLDANSSTQILGGASLALASAAAETRLKPPVKSRESTAGGSSDIRALTQAVRGGDAQAFSRFYDLYSFRVYRFLLVLARGDENEAREVCQAVFIKLAKRFEVFEEERALWAWLCTLARNAFIDSYRAEQRRNRLVSPE